jgi:hypothetical protein
MAVDLGLTTLTGLLDRTGILPESIQDVIAGDCRPVENPGRRAASDLPRGTCHAYGEWSYALWPLGPVWLAVNSSSIWEGSSG